MTGSSTSRDPALSLAYLSLAPALRDPITLLIRRIGWVRYSRGGAYQV